MRWSTRSRSPSTGPRRTERPFAIALLDIDNFRLLNETYGDAAGDDALLTVVRLLDRRCRRAPSSVDTVRTSS